MDTSDQIKIRRADWEQDADRLSVLRRAVFVREQQVPEALEWDGLDQDALHLIAEDADGAALGTARLLPTGQIGRMAVAATARRRGIGRRLLLRLLRIAEEEGYPAVFLNAQTAVLPFYAGLGFEPVGEGFVEAGIDHQRMLLADPARATRADIDTRRLGRSAGPLRLASPALQRHGIARLASQARDELLILSRDLQPNFYDQAGFLDAVRGLALQRAERRPVRVLLEDTEAPVQRGHRFIELARRLDSAIEIRCPPEDLIGTEEPCLIADSQGCACGGGTARDELTLDFDDPAQARRLRRRFESLWEQSSPHSELRRLLL